MLLLDGHFILVVMVIPLKVIRVPRFRVIGYVLMEYYIYKTRVKFFLKGLRVPPISRAPAQTYFLIKFLSTGVVRRKFLRQKVWVGD